MSDRNFQIPNLEGEPQKFNDTAKNFSDDFNPLDDVVNEKPYSQPNFTKDANLLNQDIPVPKYDSPNLGDEDAYKEINKENSTSSGGNGGGAQESEPINPTLNDVSSEDKKMAAKHMTNLIIDGYEQINNFANTFVQFKESKINKLVEEKEIDLNLPIVYDYGTEITAKDYIKEFNNQTKNTFVVTEEFKSEVKPVLQRVLEKRGAGLSDEQFLIYAFGKDIALKGITAYQLSKQMSDVINSLKENTAAYRDMANSKKEADESIYPAKEEQSYKPYKPYQQESSQETYTETQSQPQQPQTEPEYKQSYQYSDDSFEPEQPKYLEPEELQPKEEKIEVVKSESSAKRKTRQNHFSGRKRGRPKKNDISDAIIVDDNNPNPLD
jgi:hypothetical protein